jgi:hypothetical protein
MAGPRRRWPIAVGAAVVALVVGRLGASFLTERLWEARVSEAAALAGTRFGLLEAGLELLGIGFASLWFLANFGLAVRAILREFGDLPRPLGHLSERAVPWIVGGLALVLGVAVGGGTHGWLGPLALVATGVRFGVVDPLSQTDVGFFLTWLPLLELGYARALALVVPALLGVTALAVTGGLLRFVDRRIALAPRMRWHLGLLLALLALVVAGRYALAPWRLAATESATLGPAAFLLRATVAQLQIGFAAAAAVLSGFWAVRGRFVLAAGGWVGLGFAALAGTVLVESRGGAAPLAALELAPLRRMDSIAYAVRPVTVSGSSLPRVQPSLWDPEVLARLVETDSGRVVDVVPGSVPLGAGRTRVWLVLRQLAGEDVSVIAVAPDQTGPTGGPVSLRFNDSTFSPGVVPYLTLGRGFVRPGAPAFVVGATSAGVSLGSPGRRLALAWALQNARLLGARPESRVAWRLDPVDRLDRVARFADWSRPRAHIDGREVVWVVDGLLRASRFPSSQPIEWRADEARFLRPAFLGIVDARTGETHVFLRPDADSLATAWARVADPLIRPAAAIPERLRTEVGLPLEHLAVQAHVLTGPAWMGRPLARYGRTAYPVLQLGSTGTSSDPAAVPFLDEGATEVQGVIMAPWRPRSSATAIATVDTARDVAAPHELQQKWDRFPFFQQLRDSIRAAGSDYDQGLVRFWMRGDTVLAYQPGYALGPGGRTALVLVNVALGRRLGAGRTWEEAWSNLRGEVAPVPVGAEIASRLDEARRWMERADAALRRGDLQEFGRAFGFLRELLQSAAPEPPAPPGRDR